MKIGPQVDLSRTEKTTGTKTPVKSSRPKTEKKSSRLHPKDKSALGREKDEKSARKLGIVGQAKAAQTRESAPQKKPKKWTVLYYAAGDCNLERSLMGEVLDMEEAGSSSQINLVAQIDRGKNASIEDFGGVAGAASYKLEKTPHPPQGKLSSYIDESTYAIYSFQSRGKLASPPLRELGQVDSGSPEVLEDFLEWGMKNYPAENYLIIASGHGAGILGMLSDDAAIKEGKQGLISLPELRTALENAEKNAGVNKDQVILGLASCSMAQLEVASELKGTAAKLIAAQPISTSDQFNHKAILEEPGLENKNLKEMAEHIYAKNNLDKGGKENQIAQSVIDLKKIPSLEKALKKFIAEARKAEVDPAILRALMETESRSFDAELDARHGQFYASDLFKMADLVTKDSRIKDPNLIKAAQRLKDSVNNALDAARPPKNVKYRRNYHGLGIFTNSRAKAHKNIGYEQLKLAKETGWSEFITGYAPDILPEEVSREAKSYILKDKAYTELAQKSKQYLAWLKGEFKPIDEDKERWMAFKAEDAFLVPYYLWQKQPEYKKAMIPIQDLIFKLIANTPKSRGKSQAIFEVMSALEVGEISPKSISQGARNLIAAAKDPYYRNAAEKTKLRAIGARMLYGLGAISNNRQILMLEDHYYSRPEKMIREIARLDEPKRSEA